MSLKADLIGPTSLRQQKHLIDNRPHLSCIEQATDLALLGAARLDDEADETHIRSRRWIRWGWSNHGD